MQQTSVEFKKIYERDIDLLIMEEFISDPGFARLFLDKLQLPNGYTVHRAVHSLSDADGESDITLILQYPDQKIALLIEDKIDAQTMPQQSARYRKRADAAIARGEYDAYRTMLAAPSAYHEEHLSDSNAAYDCRICYEELLEYLSRQTHARTAFKAAMLEFALKEKKSGYQVQEVTAVTQFWRALRQFCKENYPHLHMLGEDSPKGASAAWPEFRTSLGIVKVIYKSQKGSVDLEFPKYGDHIADLRSMIGNRMTPSMQIQKTGKSASISLRNDRWILDFSQEFASCKPVIAEVLQAVSTLCDLASTLNYSELY